jgi:hypothetical protein
VLRHLEIQHGRLPGSHPDSEVLHRVMTRVGHQTTVMLPTLEVFTILRHLRWQHRRLSDDMLALEERRLRGGHNGHLDAAWRALDTDASILADVIRRLWDLLA